MDEAGTTQWLDEDERRTWLALAAVIVSLPNALDAQLQRDAGLSHFEYYVLAVLSEAPERTQPMSELAAAANGSLSRLSHVVSRLQRQGWVVRHPDPDNGRITLATLTEQGWAKVVATAPGHVTAVRNVVFDQLTSGQARQLRITCTRIQEGLGTPALRRGRGSGSGSIRGR